MNLLLLILDLKADNFQRPSNILLVTDQISVFTVGVLSSAVFFFGACTLVIQRLLFVVF